MQLLVADGVGVVEVVPLTLAGIEPHDVVVAHAGGIDDADAVVAEVADATGHFPHLLRVLVWEKRPSL